MYVIERSKEPLIEWKWRMSKEVQMGIFSDPESDELANLSVHA